jgi:hypothetical protein
VNRVPNPYRISMRQRLAGLLAIPIGAGVFWIAIKLLAMPLPNLLDLRVWIAAMAAILVGGAWLHLVDR